MESPHNLKMGEGKALPSARGDNSALERALPEGNAWWLRERDRLILDQDKRALGWSGPPIVAATFAPVVAAMKRPPST